MSKDEEKIVESTIETLKPKILETARSLIDGTLADKIPKLQEALSSQLWDKAVEKIGQTVGLPKEIIAKLQTIDDLVLNNKTNIEATIKDLIEKVEAYKDRLKGIDMDKMVVMSYRELQSEKSKSATRWGTVMYMLGFFSGIVTILGVKLF